MEKPEAQLPGIRPETTEAEYAAIVEAFNSTGDETLDKRMGIRLTGVGYDWIEAECPVEGNIQPYGIFHGGGHLVIAETLGSVHSALRNHGRLVVGVDLNATHVRSVSSGVVRARAEVLHGGGRMCSHEVRMSDEQGRLLSIARITNMVLGPKATKG